jgi:imidazolonepropionase-like amidohydrolase
LADVLVVDGRPDENLDDLAKVDLVIRNGYTVVQGGKAAIQRHTVAPPQKKAP